MSVVDWLFDHPLALLILGLLLIGGAAYETQRESARRCAGIMALARTHADSLNAKIACENIASDANRDLTIGISAGIIAGSAAGSRR